tara:strand:+ start:380 stop:1117 length:738 start_codon:yes stop_codon:yes gene_type:complete
VKVIASDYAAAAAMLLLYDGSSNPFDEAEHIHSFTINQLSDRLSASVSDGFDFERTEKVVLILSILGVGKFYDDPFADKVFQVSDSEIQRFLSGRGRTSDLYGRAWNLGLDWLKTAFDKTEFWEEFDKEDLNLVTVLLPAEEETFPLDHNSSAYQEASKAFDDLLDAMKTSNDIGSLSDEEAEQARKEVEELKQELDAESVNLPSFGDKARVVLSWIGKEAAGAAIGALATAALVALAKLLSIPF